MRHLYMLTVTGIIYSHKDSARRDRKKPDRLSTDGLIRRRDYPEAHTLPRHIHISCLNMTSAVFNLASNDNSRRAFPNSKFCERHKISRKIFFERANK